MKFTLPILAAAGLASAYVNDYSFLESRDLSDYDGHQLTIIARALEDFDNELIARVTGGSGSRRNSIEMQPLSRTNSWESVKSGGKASGNGHNEHSSADPTRMQHAVNGAQRAGNYAKKNPAQAASQGLSMAGSAFGAAGTISGASGNAAGAAACAAGAAACNGAANVIDKLSAAKKGAKGKRDLVDNSELFRRAFLSEALEMPMIEARSYDDDIFGDDYYYD